MSGRKRIAIYGGTFDPVHVGHIEVAKRVSELFEIDELLFVPAQVAPHKLTRPVTPAIHRYSMLVLATQEHEAMRVSTFELEAPNRRYTVDTLTHFRSKLDGSAELFFVMGADSWSEITSWREWEKLLSLMNHIVVTRPGYEIDFDLVTSSIRSRIVDLRGSQQVADAVKQASGEKIFFTDVVMLENSATEIRRALREGDFTRLSMLVPRSVANYIRKYELYRESNEA